MIELLTVFLIVFALAVFLSTLNPVIEPTAPLDEVFDTLYTVKFPLDDLEWAAFRYEHSKHESERTS